MNSERLQPYFDDGLDVYRAAEGEDPTQPRSLHAQVPFYVCTATSKKQAQKIANALNAHIPLKERKAIERKEREAKIIETFGIHSGKPERGNNAR